MARAPAAAEMGQWNAESSRVQIEYSVAVLEQIALQALAGFQRLPRGGLEVGGVLFGQADGNRVRILAARPVACDYASGPSYVLSEKDHERFRSVIEDSAGDPELAGMASVGWYHSHTRSGIFLTPADLEIQDRYFASRRQIALVIRPEGTGSARAGFFVREGDGTIRAEASYLEFPVPIVSTRTRTPEPAPEPLPPTGPPPDPLEPEPLPEPIQYGALPDEPYPEFEERWKAPRARRSGMPWVWAALAIMAALTVYTFIPHPREEAHAPRLRPLNLRVTEIAGQLQITWNAASLLNPNLRHASIEIMDGGERVLMPFDSERLRDGIATYAPRSENVEIRLRADWTTGSQEEFVRYLGSRLDSSFQPPPPLSLPPLPEEAAGKPAAPAPKQPAKVFDMARLPAAKRRPKNIALPAPPAMEPASGRAIQAGIAAPPSSTLKVAPPPVLSPARESKPAYTGPSSGRILWTGDFRRGVASTVDGQLPGVPVRVRAYPAELSTRGLTVFTPGGQPRREAPGPQNGWNATSYTADPRRANELLVLESPSAQNGWKKLTLRDDGRDLSVIIIDWKLSD